MEFGPPHPEIPLLLQVIQPLGEANDAKPQRRAGYFEDPLIRLTRTNAEILYLGHGDFGSQMRDVFSSLSRVVRPLLDKINLFKKS